MHLKSSSGEFFFVFHLVGLLDFYSFTAHGVWCWDTNYYFTGLFVCFFFCNRLVLNNEDKKQNHGHSWGLDFQSFPYSTSLEYLNASTSAKN